MIYAKKINANKTDKVMKALLIASVVLSGILILIDKLTSNKISWSALSIAGIIYVWVTVIYSIKKNTNIAGHVLIQTIAISLLTVFIDYQIGFSGWSIDISIPIIIIVANVTMLILTIVSYKKYIKYAIYQLIIVLFSMLPVIFIGENIVRNPVLSIIATSISILNFIVCIVLCTKDIKEAIIRKFHM